MRMKAIKDLSQLSEAAFVHEIAVGIDHLCQHAGRLYSEADTFRDSAPRSRQIIAALASEECAKILILLDALRMNQHELANRGRQLGYFNDHLAKGIYVMYCSTRPSRFRNVRDFVERERPESYLDGPNDYDWVFRNDILRRREEGMYVDYVETDEDHAWWVPDNVSPVDGPLRTFRRPMDPAIRRLVKALERLGVFHKSALDELQRYWQRVSISDATHWQEIRGHNEHVIAILNDRGLIRDQSAADTAADTWLFPLYPLELGEIKNHASGLSVPVVES